MVLALIGFLITTNHFKGQSHDRIRASEFRNRF